MPSQSSGDPWDDLRKWSKLIADLPECVAYIVLDHDMPTVSYIDNHDAKGRRYLRVTPAIMDGVEHRKGPGGINVLSHDSIAPGLIGVPIYRREDMSEGWPDA